MSAAWLICTTRLGELAPAALGVDEITRTRTAQFEDYVRLTVTTASGSASRLLLYKEEVWIKRDGVVVFRGTARTVPKAITTEGSVESYTIQGRWFDLSKLMYKQLWSVWDGVAEEIADVLKPRVVLGQDWEGNRITTGEQIEEIITYAIAAGLDLALGTVDAGFYAPWEETRDISCLEALQRVLRWHPEWVPWIDYTGEVPTFHCRHKDNLTVATLKINDPTALDNLSGLESIVAREDLAIPGLSITYESVHTVTGLGSGSGVFHQAITRTAGDPEDPEAVHVTVELAGMEAAYGSQRVETEDVPDEAGLKAYAWWAARFPAVKDKVAAVDFDCPEVTRVNHAVDLATGEVDAGTASDLPRILVGGSIPAWMERNGIEVHETTFSCDAHVSFRGADGGVASLARWPLTLKCYTTNAQSRYYSRLDSVTGAEGEPTGLVENLYAAWSELHYEGNLSTADEDVPLDIGPGNTLNITGGPSDLASMAALVQSVTERAFAGTRAIEIGPPRRVTLADTLALLRKCRGRGPSASAANRGDPDTSLSPMFEAKAETDADQTPDALPPEHEALTLTAYGTADAVEGKIKLEAAGLVKYQGLFVEDVAGVLTLRNGWARAHE